MPGFETLDQAISQGEAQAPILPAEVEFQDPWADEIAL